MKPSEHIRKGWCKGALARDDHNLAVGACDTRAIMWCAAGGVLVAYGQDLQGSGLFLDRLKVILPRRYKRIGSWQDSLKTPRRVIQLLEQVEQEMGIE